MGSYSYSCRHGFVGNCICNSYSLRVYRMVKMSEEQSQARNAESQESMVQVRQIKQAKSDTMIVKRDADRINAKQAFCEPEQFWWSWRTHVIRRFQEHMSP